KDCHVQNVSFNDCHFSHLRYEDIPTKFAARMHQQETSLGAPVFRYVDQLHMNATFFSVQ
ncbi:MAG: hypothetical protein IJX19_07235, partial [Clostridia bacterium]|nr:hypothetical protein [Clostridia bacterium]